MKIIEIGVFLSFLIVCSSQSAWGTEAQMEAQERSVDSAALSAQEKSEAKLVTLLAKYRHTAQESIFLQKLALLQQQEAAMRFRIAHGSAHRSQSQLDLGAYKSAMRRSITTLSEVISKFPSLDGISQSYFMRGKAYEEIGDNTLAAKDYNFLTTHYPDAEEAPASFMALAEFSITANNHAQAILFLNEVEKRPETPHYPFALYKLAWSYYNLKNVPQALSYMERNIHFYSAPLDASLDQSTASNEAFLENALLDSTVFFLEGYEQKLPQYQVSEALTYFRKLGNQNTVATALLGKMIYRFAKLLRAHGHEADLISWKNEIIAQEYKRPEALDVILTTFENQINKRRYVEQIDTVQDIVTLFQKCKGAYSFSKAQKELLENAEAFQGIILKNKGSTEIPKLSAVLASIYDTFTKIVPEQDPRVPQVHYNLAETLFEIKDYPQATTHYRWVVEHRQVRASGTEDADLKAVASHYEFLLTKNEIPKDLKLAKMNAYSDENSASIDKMEPELSKWIHWVDALANSPHQQQYTFEANRILYAQGLVQLSLTRLLKFVELTPDSRFAIPSATLILDTYVANSDWDKTYDLSVRYLDNLLLKFSDEKNTDFSKKLWIISSDSFFNKMETAYRAKDYALTLNHAEKFVTLYSKSAHFSEALAVAAGAALQSGEKNTAWAYYSKLIQEFPHSQLAPAAHAARAQIEEDRYQFAEAASDLREYLEAPTSSKIEKLDDLRRKTLLLSWLSQDQAVLVGTLNSKAVCVQTLTSDCDQFTALQALGSTGSKTTVDHHHTGLWSIVALKNPDGLEFKDLLEVIKSSAMTLKNSDGKIDSLVSFTLTEIVTRYLPAALVLARKEISQQEPLRTASVKATEKHVTRRIELIKEMETALTEVIQLPWTRIRSNALIEMSLVYTELGQDLKNIPAPKEMNGAELTAYEDLIQKIVLPFEEKGSDMRSKAFEMASRFSIETDSFALISDSFFKENPSQAQALKKIHGVAPQLKISNSLLHFDGKFVKHMDSEDWIIDEKSQRKITVGSNVEYLKIRWLRALQEKNRPQLAFFTQELHERKLLSVGAESLIRAASLAAMGAQAEALSELEEGRKNLSQSAQAETKEVLIQYRWNTYSVFKGSEPMIQAASH